MAETLDKIKSITISQNENDITIDYETTNEGNFVIARHEAQRLLYRALAKVWGDVLDQTGYTIETNQTVESQLAGQIKEKGNGLANIVGKWPGDETDEQFEEMLNPSNSKPSTKHSNPAQLKLL